MLYCTVLYYTKLYYTLQNYTILHYATLFHAILDNTRLYYTILHHAVLYYPIFFYPMLCYTNLTILRDTHWAFVHKSRSEAVFVARSTESPSCTSSTANYRQSENCPYVVQCHGPLDCIS